MERQANVHQINLNSSKGLLSPFVCVCLEIVTLLCFSKLRAIKNLTHIFIAGSRVKKVQELNFCS